MKGCMGCFLFLMVMALLGAVIQAVSFLWLNYWPMIVGLSLSWASLRYIKRFSVYDEEV
jgi:hypothetical protein